MTIRNHKGGRVSHTLNLGRYQKGSSQFAENDISRLLLSIGQSVYEFEESLKQSPKTELEILIPENLYELEGLDYIESCLQRLLSYVLLADVSVSFAPTRDEYQTSAKGLAKFASTVCLFSGGIDSVSGTLLAATSHDDIAAVYCAHLHQGRVTSITRRLSETYLKRAAIPLYEVPAPSMTVSGYSQTRGFLYVINAAAVADWLNSRKIVVSECGPTMFQPKFSPADQTTMTTHPFILERAQDILDVLNGELRIVTPYSNLTKAEVMAVCPKPRSFPKTYSCVSQRMPLHDGTCYGCVVRRLAAIASSSPDVEYARDPIVNTSANSGNLMALLDFSYNFLVHPSSLPHFQHEMIFGNRKGPLFKRFCLDNFAAIHQVKQACNALAPAVEQIYLDVVSKLGGVRLLENRIAELSNLKNQPAKVRF